MISFSRLDKEFRKSRKVIISFVDDYRIIVDTELMADILDDVCCSILE